MKLNILKLAGTALALFGLLTLFMSTSVIFDLFGIREKEGNYVLFIVWTNFICAILYLFSSYGFFKKKKWTTGLLASSAIILVIGFAGLTFYIYSGGIYETRTIGAMLFRISVTFAFALLAYFQISKKSSRKIDFGIK